MAVKRTVRRSKLRVVEFRYSESHLDRSPEFVFWAATAVAEWTGQAVIDPRPLSIAYTTPGQRGKPEHAVSIVCSADGRGGTLLQVHASPAPVRKRGELFSLDSDVALERKIIAAIEAAVHRTPGTWIGDARPESRSGTAKLRIRARGARAKVFVNGVRVPLRKSSAEVEITSGFFRVVCASEKRSRAVDVMNVAFRPSPPLIAFAAAHRSVPVPTELADVVAAAALILREGLIVFPTLAPLAPAPLPVPTPAPPVPAPAPAPLSPGATAVTAAALLVVSYWAARQWLRNIDVWIDIRDIDDDNRTRQRFCCCIYERKDTLYYPPVITALGRTWHFETFIRFFARTVIRPSPAAPCPCPPTYMFGPIPALSLHPANPSLTVNLPGGPSTGLRVFPAVRCAVNGESAAFSIGNGSTFVPPPGG